MRIGGPSFSTDHDDYYPRPQRSVAQRVAGKRRVGCDAWVVDAYYCCECAVRSDYVRARCNDDRRSPSASTVSHHKQLRVDQAAAYEQLLQLQTANDSHVLTLDDSEEAPRSLRIRKMAIAANGHCGLSREESARIEQILPAILPSHSRGGQGVTYASATTRKTKRLDRIDRLETAAGAMTL